MIKKNIDNIMGACWLMYERITDVYFSFSVGYLYR